MKDEMIEVAEKSSKRVDFANLTVSVGSRAGSKCNVLVGSPGYPGVVQDMHTGDAILYATTGDRVLEVRVTSIHNGKLGFLVTDVSPSPGGS
jgi:hypothetical protein